MDKTQQLNTKKVLKWNTGILNNYLFQIVSVSYSSLQWPCCLVTCEHLKDISKRIEHMQWNAGGALGKQALYSCGKSLDLQVNIGITIHHDIIKIMPLSPLLYFLNLGFSFESGKKSRKVTDWKCTGNKQISLRKFPNAFLITDYFLVYTVSPTVMILLYI